MRNFKNTPPYLELCLCYRCASIYFNDPNYWIEKSVPYQETTESCDFCKRSNGIDFKIWKTENVRLPDSHHCGGDRK